MPRPKQTPSSAPLSSGQAAYVLDRLISERRISPGEVNRYVSEMSREISDLEARLARLREAQGGAAASAPAAAPARRGPGRPPGRPPRPAAAAAAPAPARAAGRKGRKKTSITAEQLASRQLQGRYLALVRQFPEKKRAEFAKVAKERGREVAIEEMQKARR
jgi:hypothetical protein